MNKREKNETKPASASIGSCLRHERERQNLSIKEVAKKTRLSLVTIESLEKEDYDRLPSQQVYIRGYIRSYCKVLGIDANTLLGEHFHEAQKLTEPHDSMTTEYHYRLIRIWGSLLVVSVTAVLIFMWWLEHSAPALPEDFRQSIEQNKGERDAGSPDPDQANSNQGLDPQSPGFDQTNSNQDPDPQPLLDAQSIPPPSTAFYAPEAAPADVEGSGLLAREEVKSSLTVKIYDTCWTDIRDSRGRVIIRRLLPPGYTNTVSGYTPFEIILGNVRAVELWLDGKKQDLSPYISDSSRSASFPLKKPASE